MHDFGFYVLIFSGWIVLGVGVLAAWAADPLFQRSIEGRETDGTAPHRWSPATWICVFRGLKPEDRL